MTFCVLCLSVSATPEDLLLLQSQSAAVLPENLPLLQSQSDAATVRNVPLLESQSDSATPEILPITVSPSDSDTPEGLLLTKIQSDSATPENLPLLQSQSASATPKKLPLLQGLTSVCTPDGHKHQDSQSGSTSSEKFPLHQSLLARLSGAPIGTSTQNVSSSGSGAEKISLPPFQPPVPLGISLSQLSGKRLTPRPSPEDEDSGKVARSPPSWIAHTQRTGSNHSHTGSQPKRRMFASPSKQSWVGGSPSPFFSHLTSLCMGLVILAQTYTVHTLCSVSGTCRWLCFLLQVPGVCAEHLCLRTVHVSAVSTSHSMCTLILAEIGSKP